MKQGRGHTKGKEKMEEPASELVCWIEESKGVGQAVGRREKESRTFQQLSATATVRFAWISIWMQKPRFLLASRQNPEA